MNHPLPRPSLLIPLDDSSDAPIEELEGLIGAEHFGYLAGWVCIPDRPEWPNEPRPVLGWLGCIPIGSA